MCILYSVLLTYGSGGEILKTCSYSIWSTPRSCIAIVCEREMNTILSRLNAVFAFSLTVLAVLTFLCFLSTAFMDRNADTVVEAQLPVSV